MVKCYYKNGSNRGPQRGAHERYRRAISSCRCRALRVASCPRRAFCVPFWAFSSLFNAFWGPNLAENGSKLLEIVQVASSGPSRCAGRASRRVPGVSFSVKVDKFAYSVSAKNDQVKRFASSCITSTIVLGFKTAARYTTAIRRTNTRTNTSATSLRAPCMACANSSFFSGFLWDFLGIITMQGGVMIRMVGLGRMIHK